MKAVVAIKEIGVPADNFEIDGVNIGKEYLEYDLNEWDDYAIEEAIQTREIGPIDEIVGVMIRPERSEETMRIALAKGVDRAIRVWDDALAEQDLLDVNTKVEIFAKVIEEEDPDVVFTGVQANDDSFGATGVALANATGYEWAAVVNQFDIDADAGVANVHRELEGGLEERVTVDLPAVFTIQTGINQPRYASMRGIRQAQAKPITHRTLADLGLDSAIAEGDLRLTSMYEPESEGETEYLKGDTGEQVDQLAEILREKGVAAE